MRWTVAAFAAIAVAYALPMQSVGCNQTAHYAAIRAFAHARASIDPWAEETCDATYYHGHFYAAKAPGLDFLTVPWYLLLHALGAVPRNPNRGQGYPAAMLGVPLRALWQLGLWAAVLPALALLVLVRRAAELLQPRTGTAVAAALALGTMILPFSTLLFAHVLATCLVFGAFAVLLERVTPARGAAAGLLAGLAALVDFPVAVAGAFVGLYALLRWPRVATAGAFTLGVFAGLVPLGLFNRWAFGSFTRLSYTDEIAVKTSRGHEVLYHVPGFFSLRTPSLRTAMELLFSSKGLFVLSPILAAALAGLVLLWRGGRRLEAGVIGALVVTEVVWNSGRSAPFGGWVPGPRYLIPILPFLVLGLAPLLARRPLVVAVLAIVSIGAMTIATSAEPLLSGFDTRHWIDRIRAGNFAATIVSLAGVGHGWLAILPFFALVLVAVAAVAVASPLSVERGDIVVAAAALVAWILVEHAAPTLLHVDVLTGQDWGLVAVLALVAALTLAVARGRLLAALPLLAFATVRFDRHTKWALAVAVLAGLATVLPGRLRRSAQTA